jgi:Spy/CpxP family protein refolding chaperone
MTIIEVRKILLLTALSIGLTAVCGAQEVRPERPADLRGQLFRQLDLSREQIRQIRELNMERRPLMEAAQQRMRDATHALDAAIYADEVDDARVQAGLNEVQAAQAEVQRLRYTNELAIRRILLPDQLVRFRELRERFEQARRDLQERRKFRRRGQTDDPAPARLIKQVPKPNR